MPNAEGCSVLKQLKAVGKQAEMMFGYGDFPLWELRFTEAHFVQRVNKFQLRHYQIPTQIFH
ncbi:MAG: hypothetical protein CV089_20000 [Nitrospira sp. WS110]|nr:hypothetical protein [Nitrospira sp. WS110]